MKAIFFHLAKATSLMVLIFVVNLSIAQDADNYKVYKAKVKDNKTKTDVVFGSVTLVGTHIGTVTNSEGEFTIKVANDSKANELEISHIGYTSKKLALSTLNNEENIIWLTPTSVNLSEITVRPEEASALMEKVVKKIPENYSINDVMSAGFYRETVKQGRDYLAISEALVDIHKASYNQDLEDKIKVFKGRKSSNVKKADTLAVKLQGGPYTALLFDVAKNPYILLDDNLRPYYEYTIIDVKTIDETLNYVVEFKPKVLLTDYPMYYGKYYINTTNLAITSVEFSLDLTDKDQVSEMFVKRKPVGLKLTPLTTSYLATYKQTDGKYYFSYSRGEVKFKCNWKKRLFSSTYSIMSEIAVTDWNSEKIEKFKSKESLLKSAIFEEELTAFTDDNFWGEHNFIEPDASIETALKKYEKQLKRNK